MLLDLIDQVPVEHQLRDISCAAKGEPAWPLLALFKAMLIAVWHDLSDVRLAEALDDRSSFRRFCGFSAHELTRERTAIVRLRAQLLARGLDPALFEVAASQLRAKAITVKTGTLVDATVIASASHADPEAGWAGHQRRKTIHSFKAHVGADADTALVMIRCASFAVGTTTSSVSAAASRRYSAPGSAATGCAACDGEGWPRLPCRSTSPPSPTIFAAHSHCSAIHRHSCRSSGLGGRTQP